MYVWEINKCTDFKVVVLCTYQFKAGGGGGGGGRAWGGDLTFFKNLPSNHRLCQGRLRPVV